MALMTDRNDFHLHGKESYLTETLFNKVKHLYHVSFQQWPASDETISVKHYWSNNTIN